MGAKKTYRVLITDECLKNWERFGDYCYTVKREKKSMKEASRICESYGGHLVSIEFPGENAFVHRKLSNCWSLVMASLMKLS